ncbi:hypothetical protein HUJ04_005224 [Dendroctonus ponderosae]|nr:hypothetical protein HUJ04_005224 [Dendroctonus ponderosae]KAH1008077.1 hypothetical protein HUJ04_005224 [Dendroctonus ponderosae]
MDQDDSTGASFEIVDKKAIEQASNGDKSGTLSSVSSPYSITSPGSISLSTGNLLSNVGPPSSIPDFTLWTTSQSNIATNVENAPNAASNSSPTVVTAAPIIINQFPAPQFSAAIPPSKGVPQLPIGHSKVAQLPEAEAVAPSSFLGMVKGALSSQVVTKMVEKAKHSVDSIITTLDPQMNSSGDLEITVASEEEDIVGGVREAAHAVFGKAWVNGIKLGTVPQKSQAIGIESALILAEERIDYSFKFRLTPTVAIESVLLKEGQGWFDVYLLVLRDKEHGVNIHTFSQAIPVPVEKFIDKDAVPCWQEEVSGLTRKEVIWFAAKVLLKLYKDRLLIIKTLQRIARQNLPMIKHTLWEGLSSSARPANIKAIKI